MKVLVLYGTETGNAELVADDIQEQLSMQTEVECLDMATVDPASFTAEHRLIVVCSTYGDGELPNSAQPFYIRLQNNAPDLHGVKFATFGLGDSFYKTFNQGSDTIASALLGAGAMEVAKRGVHDASSGEMPSDVALGWLGDITPALLT